MSNTVADKRALVSIVSPCYNGETYLRRFLDSVINQTYPNIELILINDGSTDQTEQIALSYQSLFEQRGYDFKYLVQSNSGQSVAINQGLKVFQGEFLTWPDSDDVLHPDNILRKVEFLEANGQFDMVLCKSRIIDELTLEVIGTLQRDSTIGGDLFEDLIVERNVYFAPGGYMVRSSAFYELFKNRQIIEDKAGQNWQILLPFAYGKQCGIIDEYLFDYYLRQGSHSRKEISVEQLLEKLAAHELLLLKIIDSMNPQNIGRYRRLVEVKYIRRRFQLFLSVNDTKNAHRQLFLLVRSGALSGYDVKSYVKQWWK